MLSQSHGFYPDAFEIDSPALLLKQFLNILLDPMLHADGNSIRIMHNESEIPSENWVNAEMPFVHGGLIDKTAILKAMDLNCSVVLNEYFRFCPRVREILIMLRKIMGCISRCNAYLSQKNSHCFPAHSDTHNVMVMAISGTKKWLIYDHKSKRGEEGERLPSEDIDQHRYEIAEEYIMKPGDILFIPLGQFHQVQNLEDHSLHYTFSIYPKKRADIVSDIANIMQNPNDFDIPCDLKADIDAFHPITRGHVNQADIDAEINTITAIFHRLAKENFFLKTQQHLDSDLDLMAYAKMDDANVDELLQDFDT